MIPVVTRDEMRAIDAAAADPVEVLVERAGGAVASAALALLGGAYGRRVAVLAGPGNNGADGRVAAERLRERGVAVRVYDAARRAGRSAGVRSRDRRRLRHRLPRCVDAPGRRTRAGARGRRPDRARRRHGRRPRQRPARRSHGDVRRRQARTLHRRRSGCGRGESTVADIGLPVAASMWVVEARDVAAWLPRRERRAHKWRHAVRLVAGESRHDRCCRIGRRRRPARRLRHGRRLVAGRRRRRARRALPGRSRHPPAGARGLERRRAVGHRPLRIARDRPGPRPPGGDGRCRRAHDRASPSCRPSSTATVCTRSPATTPVVAAALRDRAAPRC